MRRASRHEDVYQKHVRSTHGRGEKTCTASLQTPTNMHIHHHTSHAASAGGALDDAADGARAAPVARAPAARLCAARAVQVVELEVPVGGARGERGTTRGRCRVAAATAAVGKRKSLEEEPWAAPAVARSPIVRNLPALRVESM